MITDQTQCYLLRSQWSAVPGAQELRDRGGSPATSGGPRGALGPCPQFKVNYRRSTYLLPPPEPGQPGAAWAPNWGRFSIRFHGTAGRIGAPREASWLCRTNPGPAGWIRSRKTNQGPARQIRARRKNQGPAAPESGSGSAESWIRVCGTDQGPEGRIRAPCDEPGPSRTK